MLENFRLRVFRAVAEQLNFQKAGEQLYLTQPAVTLQIKTLEEELGTKLFERSAEDGSAARRLHSLWRLGSALKQDPVPPNRSGAHEQRLGRRQMKRRLSETKGQRRE